ncbi:hypothetical protein [Gordonia amicalis]|uniref:hypothetical protein n=1 Tax=Gordonia amicalis TaxID=89053 RepID=UPI0002A65351|nr:hypothetical protein [Gordonia amicalis]MDV7099770.1 hypothetical protein [Gordonia amicalis]MDV7171874.1 hypothetical protein [Gordonia amicalis]UKO91111.1 hypothetical protein IHQ52_19230 [Gordonia amicalis]UOG22578.1 hypothetical protein MTX80_06190 [Gordonia amicalis]GAC51840.1 Mce family protein [Gordonia amicalis NBRC 100051 = JCM 11271]
MQRVGLRKAVGGDAALGIGFVVIVVVTLLVLGLLYMRPPAQKTFSFETTDASAVTAGQDVRVAGISVARCSR